MFIPSDLPNSVHLQERSRHPLTTGYTKITLLCSADESNPVSDISWTGLEKIQSKLFSATEQDGEYGGSQMLQVKHVVHFRDLVGTNVTSALQLTYSKKRELLGRYQNYKKC